MTDVSELLYLYKEIRLSTIIHTCIKHTYIQTYINTCIHTYIHTYIQTYIHTYIHHIGIMEENLVNSSLPKALERNVEELNFFIKPARPNLEISFDLKLTNQNWATEIMNVLIKHYASCLKNLESKIISAMSSKNLDFDRAQITAIKWGRKNYKTKLTESSLSEFSRFLSDLTPKKSGNSMGSSCQTTTPCLLDKNEHDHHPLLTPL